LRPGLLAAFADAVVSSGTTVPRRFPDLRAAGAVAWIARHVEVLD
jgi:hypothetical protein